jgi:hypothetical protein
VERDSGIAEQSSHGSRLRNHQIEFGPSAFRSAAMQVLKAVKHQATYDLKDWQWDASHQIAGRLRITVYFLRASCL